MASKFLNLLLVIFAATCGIITAQESCRSPRHRPGHCVNIKDCPVLMNIYKNSKSGSSNFLKNSQCGYEGTYPKVCCEHVKRRSQVVENTYSESSRLWSMVNPPREPKIEVAPRMGPRRTTTEGYKESPVFKEFDTSVPVRPHSRKNSAKVPSCPGLTYCEDVSDYPQQLVIKVIQENPELHALAMTDVVEYDKYDLNDKIDLCTFEEKLIYPKSALSRNEQWLYILNTDTLAQGVRIQTCRKRGKPCDEIAQFPDDVVSSCEQNHTYRRLAAIHPNGTVLKDEWFSFPSSCCCSATRYPMDMRK